MRHSNLRFVTERMLESLYRMGATCVVIAETDFATELIDWMAAEMLDRRGLEARVLGSTAEDGPLSVTYSGLAEQSTAHILPPDEPLVRYAGICSHDVTVIVADTLHVSDDVKTVLRSATYGAGLNSVAVWIELTGGEA